MLGQAMQLRILGERIAKMLIFGGSTKWGEEKGNGKGTQKRGDASVGNWNGK